MRRCIHEIDRDEEVCAFCAADEYAPDGELTSVRQSPLDGSPISEHDYEMMRHYADLIHAERELSDELSQLEYGEEAYGDSGLDTSGLADARADRERRLSDVVSKMGRLSAYADGGRQMAHDDQARAKTASEQRALDAATADRKQKREESIWQVPKTSEEAAELATAAVFQGFLGTVDAASKGAEATKKAARSARQAWRQLRVESKKPPPDNP